MVVIATNIEIYSDTSHDGIIRPTGSVIDEFLNFRLFALVCIIISTLSHCRRSFYERLRQKLMNLRLGSWMHV